MKTEIWKDIPTYEGEYQVSNTGKVRSLKSNKELKQSLSSGYYGVTLSQNGIVKGKRIHQLMAMAFLGHKPNKYKYVIDHIDNDKLNNDLINLRIVTHRENISKARKKNKYTGVCWHKIKNQFIASIQINGKLKHIGYFENEYDAHLAYELKLSEYAQMQKL
jgi:hypothetical protein